MAGPASGANRRLWLRLVGRALVSGGDRRLRMAIALVALSVGAMLASALLTTYGDLEGKMAGELRGFGANLVIAPARGIETSGQHGTLEAAALALSQHVPEAGTLPLLYVVGEVRAPAVTAGDGVGEPAVLAGTRFDRLRPFARTWQWQGRAPRAGAGECAVGERLAERFRLSPGSPVEAQYQGRALELTVAGVVETGASEDTQLLMNLEELQALAGLPGRVSLVQVLVPGNRAEVEAARASIEAGITARLGAAVEVRTLLPVAEASARVLLKVKTMLFAVTGLVLGIVGLCVMTTLSAMVLERRKEIALMKAIGAGQRRISAMFLAEAGMLAVAGGVLGYAGGVALARYLSQSVFRAPVEARLVVLPEVLAVTVVVALLATLAPLRLVRRVDPAVILKGE